MNSPTVEEVSQEITKKAEHYAEVGGGYAALTQQVMQMGGKAFMTKRFTLQQAEQMTAMMLAAITLAKQAGQK